MRRATGVLVLAGVALTSCGTGEGPSPTSVPSSTTSSTITGSSTTAPAGIAPYLALWPFKTVADVQAWQRSYSANGADAWHLDPSATARSFTTGYLGFSEVGAPLRVVTNSTGAHVSVGFQPASGPGVTAAVVHLVRWGAGPDAPWEVVGTDDTTFSLTTPAYGAAVSSPLKVGGTISGVDENIRVTVRQPSSPNGLGSSCCTPGGGTDTPWSATVSYSGAGDPVLTIVAATGGHVRAVERFTVTGVRTTTR